LGEGQGVRVQRIFEKIIDPIAVIVGGWGADAVGGLEGGVSPGEFDGDVVAASKGVGVGLGLIGDAIGLGIEGKSLAFGQARESAAHGGAIVGGFHEKKEVAWRGGVAGGKAEGGDTGPEGDGVADGEAVVSRGVGEVGD